MNNATKKWLNRLNDTNNAWTENDIKYFRKAIGYCGFKNTEVKDYLRKTFYKVAAENDGYLITNDQSEKGREYLLSKSLKQNEEFRKGSKLGAREIGILKDLDHHKFVGLYEQYNGLGEILGYLPIYRAVSRSGKYFEYVGTVYEQLEIVA